MRIGEVVGRITLNKCDPMMTGGRFLLVQPYDPQSLRENKPGKGERVIVYDRLGAGLGHQVGFSEGREGACPFYPERVAIDAYLACILDEVTYS
ncbi:MAG: carbon dioxide concentrating mechanism protein CcmL [Planctomycetota bacterium]|nr:MAG: carbon dioxide concentrating mechanism protein CcmL [Planctomycetota bacterium]